MKRIIMAALLTMVAAGVAAAADTVVLPAKNGDVTFTHKLHVDRLKDCKACHETAAGGKIAALGKDWAHKTCKGCHSDKGAGPTKCGECHKK